MTKTKKKSNGNSFLGTLAALIILCVVLTIVSDKFLTYNNLMSVLKQTTFTALLSTGMLLCLITAGIDLSVGANATFCACICGMLVKGGMTNCQNEMKKAVEAGYWNLFTFNPANKAQGKNPFTLTSKAVDNEKYQALLANETRYSRLTRAFPERAKELFARNQEVANDRYEHLTRLVELYK